MKKLLIILMLLAATPLYAMKYKNQNLAYTVSINVSDSGIFYNKPYSNTMHFSFEVKYNAERNMLYLLNLKAFANGAEQVQYEADTIIYDAVIDSEKGFILRRRLVGPQSPFIANLTELFPKFPAKKRKKWKSMYRLSKELMTDIDYKILSVKKSGITIEEKFSTGLGGIKNMYGTISGRGILTFSKGKIVKSDLRIRTVSEEKMENSVVRKSKNITIIKLREYPQNVNHKGAKDEGQKAK